MLPRAANSYLIVNSSGKVNGGSVFFLMHSTLMRCFGCNCNAQFAGPRICTPQTPNPPPPKLEKPAPVKGEKKPEPPPPRDPGGAPPPPAAVPSTAALPARAARVARRDEIRVLLIAR